MRLWSYQSIARGADGICFFQWRQARAGAEKFHGSMFGHGDPATQRCFQEVKQLGNELFGLTAIAGTRFVADAAIYFDQENWWALELPSKPNNNLKYNRAVENFYTALLNRNIATDFAFGDSDLSRYKLLFVPTLYLVKPGVAEQLEAYVAAGGISVFTYFNGIVDEADRVLLGGYPAPFRKLLGLSVEEWSVPPDDRTSTISSNVEGFAKTHTSSFWAEVIRPEGAEIIAVFDDDYYAGLPAVTRHRFGKGEAWYLGTELEPAFYDELICHLAKKAGVHPPLDVPQGVEVTRRRGEGKDFLFLLNHGSEAATIDLTDIHCQELLTGRTAAGLWSLPARGVAILSISSH